MNITPPVTLRFTGKLRFSDKLAAAALAAALLVLAADVLVSAPAAAQLRVPDGATPQQAWNPNPAEDDFVVPLPCGLSMAFRPVFIPAPGYLGEIASYFGFDPRSEDDGNVSLDRRREIYLGSPLSIGELPEPYRPTALALKKAISPDKDGRQLYLVGKYELTVAQWDAVTEHTGGGGSAEPCPFDPKTGALPVTDVSWYEAQQFTSKLMDWLLANHPEALPSMEDDQRIVGVVRLPTEDEWEYAARGGHLVSSADMAVQDFFPVEPGKRISDYGLYNDGASERIPQPAMIGSREPNPAGLYDTVGNVSEMTIDNFRIIAGGRLHGSAGGFVVKGGSFFSRYEGVSPGARIEFPFYFRSGQAKNSNMGLRLVISSMNLGGVQRLSEITAELDRMAYFDQSLAYDDPLKTVDSLIRNADSDSEKNALRSVRVALESSNANAENLRSAEVRSKLMDSLYAMLSMRANNTRMISAAGGRQTAVNYINRLEAMVKGNDASDDEKKAFLNAREEQIKLRDDRQAFLLNGESSFLVMRGRYEKLLADVKGYPSDLILAQLAGIGRDFQGSDYFSYEMRSCFKIVEKHLKAVLEGASPSDIPRDEMELKRVDIEMPMPTV